MWLIKALSNILFPHKIKCIACEKELSCDSYSGLCERCVKACELSKNTSFCMRCGRFIKSSATYCLECQTKPPALNIARAPFVYDGEIRKLIYALKFGNARYLAEYMAKFMADTYLKIGISADFVTFVPMYPRKQKARGYNQSQLLAAEVAKLIDLPCINILDRVKDIKNTAKLRRSQRKELLRDSIEVVSGVDFNQKRVLIVDDVYTTGTTVSECSRKLKACGVLEVNVLTFATGKIIALQKSVSLSKKVFFG